MTPTEYCRQQAAPPGSDLYYATLFLPQQQKPILNALFALQSELDQVIFECSDPGIAQMKLQWWREELTRLNNGEPRHPVCMELYQLPCPSHIIQGRFNAYVDHVEWLLSGGQPDTYRGLQTRLVQGPGLLWRTAMEICAADNHRPEGPATKTGVLTALLRLFLNSRPLIEKGICPLPKQEMENHRLDRYIVTGSRYVEQTRELFIDLFNRFEEDIDENYHALNDQHRSPLLLPITMNRLMSSLCLELRKSGFPLMETKITLTPVRKLWIAWLTKWKS